MKDSKEVEWPPRTRSRAGIKSNEGVVTKVSGVSVAIGVGVMV